MKALIRVSVPFLWIATVLMAAVGQGTKMRQILQGVEPTTPWILIGMLVVTVVVTMVAIKLED